MCVGRPGLFLFARFAGPLTLHRLQQPAPAAHRLQRPAPRRPACCIPCQRRPPALCQHTADRRAILRRLHTASHKAASTARRLAAPGKQCRHRSFGQQPRPPAGSPPRWRRPARRAASCNDPAPAARRRADDHGPPAPAPVGTGSGVSILYGSESPKIF